MSYRILFSSTVLGFLFLILPAVSKEIEKVRIEHEVREIEGWTVHVDVSLLKGEHQEMGDLALKILGQRLHQIVMKLPAEPVAEMRKVPIFLDRNHPLGNAHYHPEANWLEERGYDPAMGKAVQFTGAQGLINGAKRPHGGSVVLHELAHAYHDRVLGFDHPEILEAYQKFCDTEKFDAIPLVSGDIRPHYGLTDHKEYFAEMTETFFVGNNYFPFTHFDLYHEHQPTYEMVAKIWGVEVKPPTRKVADQPGILDLRILANLKSQRGDFDEALELISQAEARSDDFEGRLAGLRALIEERRAVLRPDRDPIPRKNRSCSDLFFSAAQAPLSASE